LWFDDSIFYKNVTISKTSFNSKTTFIDTEFNGKLELKNVNGIKKADWSGVSGVFLEPPKTSTV